MPCQALPYRLPNSTLLSTSAGLILLVSHRRHDACLVGRKGKSVLGISTCRRVPTLAHFHPQGNSACTHTPKAKAEAALLTRGRSAFARWWQAHGLAPLGGQCGSGEQKPFKGSGVLTVAKGPPPGQKSYRHSNFCCGLGSVLQPAACWELLRLPSDGIRACKCAAALLVLDICSRPALRCCTARCCTNYSARQHSRPTLGRHEKTVL